MSPSPASAETLADEIADLFIGLPQVEAVALGGSKTSGVSDSTSDLDLYVYTTADIPLAVRQSIVEKSGGATKADLNLTHWGPGDEWYHAGTGIEVDIIYFEASWMAEQLHRVTHEHRASLGYTTCFWYTIAHSHRLRDPRGWLQALQQQSQQEYPEALRQNIITLNHSILRNVIPAYFNQLQKAVQRHDLVSVNHRLSGLLASYFEVIFALNRLLHPGEKRLVEYARRHCQKFPANMAEDIHAVLRDAATAAPIFLVGVTRLLDRLDVLLQQEGFDPRTSRPKLTT